MKTSAYSKMYLVLPSIYDKVLKSIDEKDKKVLEQLNVDKENNTSRPAAKYLDEIANTELQENNTPQTEFIDPETINEPEQTFGESEANMVHFLESCKRGGVAFIGTRDMKPSKSQNDESEIVYLDANVSSFFLTVP